MIYTVPAEHLIFILEIVPVLVNIYQIHMFAIVTAGERRGGG